MGKGNMSRARQFLCVFYGLVALTALIMTWSQNLLYFTGASPADIVMLYITWKANPAMMPTTR